MEKSSTVGISAYRPSAMDHMDVVGVVPEHILRIAIAILYTEFFERVKFVADSIGCFQPQCVHCAVECTRSCPFCGMTVCFSDRSLHLSTKCLMYKILPLSIQTSESFHLIGLSRISRSIMPKTHPVARPLCASGNGLEDRSTALTLMDKISSVIQSEVQGYEYSDATHDRDHAARIICDVAKGLSTFAALLDAESQRGSRCVSIEDTLTSSTCCPLELAQAVPPFSNSQWRLLQLTYNHPEHENRPLCVMGERCVGFHIKQPDQRRIGQPLRAMRSPYGELLSDETDDCGGLCLLCMTKQIVSDLRSQFLWQEPEGMFQEKYLVFKGSFRIVNADPLVLCVNKYVAGGHTILYVDERALRNPNSRHF